MKYLVYIILLFILLVILSIYNSKKQVITSFDYQLDDAGYVVKYTTKNFDYTTGSQTVKTGEAIFVWK